MSYKWERGVFTLGSCSNYWEGSDHSAYLSLRCRLLRFAGSKSRGWLSLQACPILSIQPLMPESRPEETLQPSDQLRSRETRVSFLLKLTASPAQRKFNNSYTWQNSTEHSPYPPPHYFKLLYTQHFSFFNHSYFPCDNQLSGEFGINIQRWTECILSHYLLCMWAAV